MMARTAVCAAVALLLAAGLVFAEDILPADSSSADALLGLSAEEASSIANAWGLGSQDNKIMSYVTSSAVNFEFPDGVKTVVGLPLDRMVVAVAPFIMKTHPCSGHYLSSCGGELKNTSAHVTAVDADGQPILSEDLTTLPNGFLELWLPRDREIDVTIQARGQRASGRISTFADSNTCITTLRLHP